MNHDRWDVELGSGEDASGVHKRCHRCRCRSVVILAMEGLDRGHGVLSKLPCLEFKEKGESLLQNFARAQGSRKPPPRIVWECFGKIYSLVHHVV